MADDPKPPLRLVSDRTKGEDFESFERFGAEPEVSAASAQRRGNRNAKSTNGPMRQAEEGAKSHRWLGQWRSAIECATTVLRASNRDRLKSATS